MNGKAMEKVVVTVDEEYRDVIGQVVSELESAGLKVARVMGELGVIAGEAEAARFSALRTVPGVQEVERDEEMRAL